MTSKSVLSSFTFIDLWDHCSNVLFEIILVWYHFILVTIEITCNNRNCDRLWSLELFLKPISNSIIRHFAVVLWVNNLPGICDILFHYVGHRHAWVMIIKKTIISLAFLVPLQELEEVFEGHFSFIVLVYYIVLYASIARCSRFDVPLLKSSY